MTLRRRISATFKDLPGGQMLGPTFDYTQRLLDFDSLAKASARAGAAHGAAGPPEDTSHCRASSICSTTRG